MSARKLGVAILGITLSVFPSLARAQMTEQAARQQALATVRSQLHLTSEGERPVQFLSIRRAEDLEESLAIATAGWNTGPRFIYTISRAGVEIRKDTLIHHIFTDGDPSFTVVVDPENGDTYGVHGFGLTKSTAEFERLISSLKFHVSNADQAQSVADFYRQVNPGNFEDLGPLHSLLEFKQAAERQCQNGSFDRSEEAFRAWWGHASPRYRNIQFQETATAAHNGYLVNWVVSTSSSSDSCGGIAEQATLPIGSDGRVGELSFSAIH